LDGREISTDREDYEDVPTSGAYVTVKTTKETGEDSYRYFYRQWREGDPWKNEYIAPVNPREESSYRRFTLRPQRANSPGERLSRVPRIAGGKHYTV
jgi:hypothetical protein